MIQSDGCGYIHGGRATGRYNRERGDSGPTGHLLSRAHLHRGCSTRQRRPYVPLPAQHYATGAQITHGIIQTKKTLPC